MTMAGGGRIPAFMNHLESGSFQLDSAPTDPYGYGEYIIQLSDISKPKGILLYSNEFNMFDNKADKPILGAFASLYIAPADIDNATKINGYTNITPLIWYYVNWGNEAASNPTARYSAYEGNRGIYLYNETSKQIIIRGFRAEQSDYDFKLNTLYHWLVWD